MQDVDDTEQSADEKLHNDAEKRGSEPIINGKSELSTSKRSSLSQIKKSDDSKPTMPEDTRVSFIALYKVRQKSNCCNLLIGLGLELELGLGPYVRAWLYG